MKKFNAFFALSFIAILPVAAQASDLPIKKGSPKLAVSEQNKFPKSFISGAFEVGAIIDRHDSSESGDVSGTLFGGYGAAFANIAVTDQLSWGIDAQSEILKLDSGEHWSDFAPGHASIIGSNLVLHNGSLDVGAFGAISTTNSDTNDDDDAVSAYGYQIGAIIGVDVANDTSVFLQPGYADIRVDPDDTNEEGFTGWFVNGGLIKGVGEKAAVAILGGYGSSDNFEDDDEGRYWNAGLKGTYKLSDVMPLFLSGSYSYNDYASTGNDEGDGDKGNEHIMKVGISLGFGGNESAKSVINPYGSSLSTVRAAAWGEVLD